MPKTRSETRRSYVDASRIVTGIPLVTRKILSHLTAKQLKTSAQVCRQWQESAKYVNARRNTAAWFATDNDDEDIISEEEMKKLESEPKVALVMSYSEIWRNAGPCVYSSDDDMLELTEQVQRLQKSLPKNCLLIGFLADGVISPRNYLRPWGPSEEMENCGIGVLLLPQMPGVHVSHFRCDLTGLSPGTDIYKLNGVHDTPKFSIVTIARKFYASRSSGPSEKQQNLIKSLKNDGQTVVAGAIVENFIPGMYLNPSAQSGMLQALTFSGDDIQVASIVLGQTVKIRNLDYHMRRLQAADVRKENRIGFMFACVCRGKSHYDGEGNVEANCFHRHFPDVPLFGLFGFGEFGTDVLPTIENFPENKRCGPGRILHAFCTVFVIISFGPSSKFKLFSD